VRGCDAVQLCRLACAGSPPCALSLLSLLLSEQPVKRLVSPESASKLMTRISRLSHEKRAYRQHFIRLGIRSERS